MLYDYILNVYKPGEPIFTVDIEVEGMSHDNMRQQFKKLVDTGVINRFENGIYYIPEKTELKGYNRITPEVVASYKYIERLGVRIGYYAGFTFANQLGLTMQVPYKKEIVSNNMAAIKREVRIGNQSYIVRKPVTKVTEENYRILQLLDLIKDLDMYIDDEGVDAQERLSRYIKKSNITRDMVDKYIGDFPLKVYKNIYEMRLDYVFA